MWRCDLDPSGVLQGYTEVGSLAVGEVGFDVKPDLDLARYRWNGETFVPVGFPVYMPDGPDAWYALYRLCRRLEKQGVINLPAPTKQWMDYYRMSFTKDPVTE